MPLAWRLQELYKRSMQTQWIFPRELPSGVLESCFADFSLSPLTRGVLLRNGITDPDLIEKFLRPRLSSLSDPYLLPDMQQAVDRIDTALRKRQKILLYGDYDVDGVTSLTILARLLLGYGGDVRCFMPNRTEEGYGLSEPAVRRCFQHSRPDLLIALDCATNSVQDIARIRSQGVDVIVIDHHEYAGVRPDCCALVNPKTGKDFHYFCTAGLAFKVAHALLKNCPLPGFDLKDTLDLVALASLADLVPLVEENRILVRRGLRQMECTRWPGLAALIRLSGICPPIRSSDVGFRLCPRINAAGRLGEAETALELLLTNDPAKAAQLAAILDAHNRERKNVEREVNAQVEAFIEKFCDPVREFAIVAGDEDWHDGVLGIVASRVMRRFHRPTLVVGFSHNGLGKGSGRSIEGFSLVNALGRCAPLLEQYGGHEMAAGLTMRRENFEEFRRRFEAAARQMLEKVELTRTLRLDAEIRLEDIDFPLLEEQSELEPFGMGNQQPMLVVRGVTPAWEPRILKDRHVRIEFLAGRRRINAIFFDGLTEGQLPRPPWDVAFRLERNEFQGRIEPQMQITAIRHSA
jgi:single-stranded-DNA-specific exonuclease